MVLRMNLMEARSPTEHASAVLYASGEFISNLAVNGWTRPSKRAVDCQWPAERDG